VFKKTQKPKFKIIWPQFLLRLFLLLLLVVFSLAGYFIFKIKAFEKNINDSENKNSSIIYTTQQFIKEEKQPLRGEEKNRINILLLGMGGEGHHGQYLTDTILLASINPQTYETALLAIPRDLYVEIPETQIHTKINAVYAYGRNNSETLENKPHELIKKTVEKITGQKIDYHIAINFEGFKKVIDELGGIIIQVEEDIVDHKYPGPGRSYETFKIDKGTHLVNGDVALKYARVRHVKGGDFSRLERQKDIILSAKKRAFSLENFLNPIKISNLMNTLEGNLQTDIQLDEIPAFIELLNKINPYNINSKVLDAWSPDSLLAVSHVLLGNVQAFILVPRTGNYQEIQNLAENIFDLNKIEKEKEAIEKESARILVVSNQYQNSPRVKNFFEKMGYSVEAEENSEIYQNCQQNIKIFAPQNSEKIYTLNDLTRKFQADIEENLDFDYSEKETDVVLCFPKKEIEKIEKQIDQTSADDFQEESILDNEGNIMYNKN
jgi:LCP family protein required for cell wall assembly